MPALNTASLSCLTLIAVGATAAIAILVLRKSLRNILIDLCGNEHRATFWSMFASVCILLASLIGAMLFPPGISSHAGSDEVFIAAFNSFRAGMVGLLCALVAMGLIIAIFISGAAVENSRRDLTEGRTFVGGEPANRPGP